jgi:hypothetical protein
MSKNSGIRIRHIPTGNAVNNIINNKNDDQTHQNWESILITSTPFPFLRTSFPSGQIPVPSPSNPNPIFPV